ncbi:aminotransferase class III-fold pyridoxal phosphate-dependent enzyme [Crenobacter sp. SG2305]|uniref:aspartate aminotransferase family protein n=1 Tax=Crenobacter oryzisoli TaxID=3056844 RepID=UPI0025AB2505|nr:aminotransferase class III-fold pyridoxal phosphate-dependent enzyme [Crenobacter sp. SG2305]MDN0081675.1 aminotransferase class III-fold pyridoxal phosphate-dependent enzyme [Crenobacter sp. SG2305]
MSSKDQRMVNAFDPATSSQLPAREQALIQRRQQSLGKAYRLFYEHPVHVTRAEGVWLYDPDGKPYLDVYNNVASVGHSHPRVVEAIARQAATLNTHTRYLNETILEYAERLLATFPAAISQAMFTCTGSEANDLALRLAWNVSGGRGVIVSNHAYHGVTHSVAECSPAFGPSVPLGPHVRTVPPPDGYRHGEEPVGERFVRHVQAAIEDLQRHGIQPAALLVDTLFTSDGVFADPPGYLARAAEAIRAAGGVFIADEVQAGFARSGGHYWGFQRHGVVPDIVTMGKPMGNGHPIAGLVARPEIIDAFGSKVRYFNTFGGNPVSCAAGMAVLDVIHDEGMQQNARDTGAYLKAGFELLAEKYPLIGDVRGVGFFIGVEMVSDRQQKTPASNETSRIVNALRDKRILISATGPAGNVLKVRPQLVFAQEHADMLLDALDNILATL